MWSRFRRRSMAPRRPAIHADQLGLAILSLLAIVLGLYTAVRILFG